MDVTVKVESLKYDLIHLNYVCVHTNVYNNCSEIIYVYMYV